ncbi:MAG: Galactoside O-acetyltransferase [Bacteroidetes bacterium ADurb.Bin408]|nr:MAG: Galactoside O-acetyltransferase [Bacteroidetes bacterium ADurb.Bin408]
MFKRINRSLSYRLSKFFRFMTKPRMLGIRKNFQGKSIEDTSIGNTTFIDYPENFVIWNHTYIGHHNFIEASQGITLGEGCQITDFVSITTHSSHISIRLYGAQYSKHSHHKGYLRGSIQIGAYSFVGPHTVIMPGTTIGKGSIVSAFSYVKGNFPDFAVISGNPATVTGDTRELDKAYLEENPELKVLYESWSK